MNILLIGAGAREHAIARAITQSAQPYAIFCYAPSLNPGIAVLAADYELGALTLLDNIVTYARAKLIDFAIIGPEAPLEDGLVDKLESIKVPSIGPKQQLAQIETSKGFARDLLTRHRIPGCPAYKRFNNMDGVAEYLTQLQDEYVIKADGLMGGKGVKLAGEHLRSHAEALAYCEQLVTSNNAFVIEEKLVGQEFSLLSFSDGEHLAHMPVLQDHKRAYIDDKGPNTGGMGSYSDADHSLPFLSEDDIAVARAINDDIIRALHEEFGCYYKGVLYGGFMLTSSGIKLIEYNARFGDPEAINLLPLLESDFITICQAIIFQELSQDMVRFSNKASVCKYVVPEGYPIASVKNQLIDVTQVKNKDSLYFAAVDEQADGNLLMTGSRAIAVLGVADTITAAEHIAEQEVKAIQGPIFHRQDIGTRHLINKRIEHINQLCGREYELL